MRDVDESAPEATLLAAVTAVADELHPGRTGGPAHLDSRLDRDLGFDSLGRVELLARLERLFGVALPDRAAAEAETPRDLLRAVLAAPRPRLAEPTPAPAQPAAGIAHAAEVPLRAETWLDVLDWHERRRPEATHIRFYADQGAGDELSHAGLMAGARGIAAGLVSQGIGPGEAVALMLPTGRAYFVCFVGILLVGAVPVPLYPPFRATQLEEHLRRQAGILANCLAPLLITAAELQPAARLLIGQVRSLRAVVSLDDLHGDGGSVQPRVTGADTALLQYTSGSTGAPKGVILNHANLLANVRAIGAAARVRPQDVVVSWLPLYHDMGLIGAWLGSLYHGIPLVLMSPLAFVARPVRWLAAIHRHGGTLTAAPNFAFELCLRRIADDEVAGLDLSTLRGVYNGAEAISPQTMERFIARFAPRGFRREAMMPVYGLAESSVGLAFTPLGRGPRIDAVQRQHFVSSGDAIAATDGGADGGDDVRFVSCGVPLPGHEIRVVDASDRELPERREGRIQFRGPSSTSGYFRNPEATAALFRGDWCGTGDLGYLAGGELYVTGRVKDIVIRAGRNIHPEEIEEAVGAIAGIRKGNVAVFGVTDAHDATERLVVMAETRKPAEGWRDLETAVAAAVIDLVGMPPDRVVLAPPNTILKTSSGKIRRAACRRLYEEGAIGRARKPVWRQIIALRFAGLRTGLHRLWADARGVVYAGYAWAAVAVFAVIAWPAVVLLPRQERRWRLLRSMLRGLARATATRLTVSGPEGTMPSGPVIYVTNHASYLDSFVLAATLPGRLSFVAKAELGRAWWTRLPLRRLGTAFVERLAHQRSVADARALPAFAMQGRSLVFFAEGTFTRMPGLLPFHMGAFELATSLWLPVVPVAIRGTRSMLRSGSWWPRPGAIAVAIGPAMGGKAPSPDKAWQQACRLRDEARAWILDHCGEPDLAHERAPL